MKTLKRLLPLLLFLALTACSDRDLPVPPDGDGTVIIEQHSLPEYLNIDATYIVSTSVTAEDVQVVSLEAFIKDSSTPISTLMLYDDGAAVDTSDGDIVANDGIFSQKLFWDYDVEQIQDVEFIFTAIRDDETVGEPAVFQAKHIPNLSPEIRSISGPDTLKSGIDGIQSYTVVVSDLNGLDDIKTVQYRGLQNDIVLFQGNLQPGDNDSSFALTVDSSFAIGKKGEYQFQFVAVDMSDSESDVVNKTVIIENNAPVLGQLSALSEVVRPLEGNSYFLIELEVFDEQGLGDIKQVMMSWALPDGSYAPQSPFQLFDNGLPFEPVKLTGWDTGARGDVTADDGVYSITGVFDYDDDLKRYTLVFWAEDLAGNKSEEIVHFVTLK